MMKAADTILNLMFSENCVRTEYVDVICAQDAGWREDHSRRPCRNKERGEGKHHIAKEGNLLTKEPILVVERIERRHCLETRTSDDR